MAGLKKKSYVKTTDQVLQAFENVRRARNHGVYAPHKPLLILLALARVQQGKPRLVEYSDLDLPMKKLLSEFGPSSAAKSRHYPFWYLRSDGDGALWDLNKDGKPVVGVSGGTPTLTQLRGEHFSGGFPRNLDKALRKSPGLLRMVANRVLDSFFPETLHSDIAAAIGLDLEGSDNSHGVSERVISYADKTTRRRDPAFRENILRLYEYRCCVCEFDLRIGHSAAGLEAAHIQWHQAGGPDEEPNGLCLCALHHKLFDLGVFTVEPVEYRVVFSQHAVAGDRSAHGELRHHGQPMRKPIDARFNPATEFLDWNVKNVFKAPGRPGAP